ncbi:hypothetical protein YSA_08851 [Pseudomonas putida ND6]|uniref:Uncharacterized protein n=1 Tax=Pseudomonas putida ND6 TaxID=231023 RepID=I3V1D6_PSEPU|nr:hypothetical protein YSA_08851 [Pseudomonas putida ND6]
MNLLAALRRHWKLPMNAVSVFTFDVLQLALTFLSSSLGMP